MQSKKYQKLTDVGTFAVWLSDSRRLIFSYQGKIFLSDRESKKYREIFSVPQNIASVLSVTQDNRFIFFSRAETEADIWLLTLK